MNVLVTGAAGFIGFHVAQALLERGDRVVGVDNLNDYYDVGLKQARLSKLTGADGFEFEKLDIADRDAMNALATRYPDITRIVHLAAQAGVLYSLQAPEAYVHANLNGQLAVLEASRRLERLEHLVFASSSSVYGGSTDLPFSLADRADTPVSLYAATKRGAELISHSYSHIYGIPQTGLRFFTVYGPWGRPDMAYFKFTRLLLAGEPIQVYNNGDMRRDFTYIDDIVSGVLACLDRPPSPRGDAPPYRLYNLGNMESEGLMDFIAIIEQHLGCKAEIELCPMQAGEVKETFADIAAAQKDFGFKPTTRIQEGIPRFIDWYRAYYNISQ